MKIVIIILLIVMVLYFIFTYGIAKFMANLIFTPPQMFRPTREMVVNNTVKEFASNHYIYSDTNYQEYDKWETEKFQCINDGVEIPAEYHPVENARGCVILAHGFGQNRYAAVPYAEIFRKLGFSTVIFDERCFGESKAPNGGFGELEATDIVTLIHWVKEKCGKDTKIVLHGVSMGAMSSMNALQYSDEIDYVIEDCGPARACRGAVFVANSMIPVPNPFMKMMIKRKSNKLGLNIEGNNPVDAVKNSNVPIMIIHGGADRAVSVEDAKEIRKAAHNPKARLEIFLGRDHAYSICDREKYEHIVEEFLKDI